MGKIIMLAYDGCLFSSLELLADAFTISNLWYEKLRKEEHTKKHPTETLFETQVATLRGEPFITNSGIRIQPDCALEDTQNTDLILIAPYLFGAHGYDDATSELIRPLISQYENGVPIGAICTAAFILARTGLLDGKIATTNWQVTKTFQQEFPNVILKPDRILTEDQGLICTGAATSQYNLALHIIEKFGNQELARTCSKVFLVDPRRISQAPYIITNFKKNHGDDKILNAQNWMEENYTDILTVDSVAHHVGMSPRHFKRRFKSATNETPLSYLHQVRIEVAKKELEGTKHNIDEITRLVGYEDSGTFRRLFKKLTSLSPREYRDKFRAF